MFKCNNYFDSKVKSRAIQTTGERFGGPGDNSAFDVRVLAASAYLCLYG